MQPQIDMSVQYEVLDANGHKTGQILDRATVHKQQLWHEVVHVWIMNSKSEILMQLRAPGVELSPNVWDVTIGTHLRLHEAPIDAALRCLSEQLGLNVAREDLKHLFNMQCENPVPNGTVHKVFEHVFLVNRDLDPSELTFDPAKITRMSWVSLTQLMAGVGSTDTKNRYLPRSSNYYTKLFESFMA